jgi:hypothetical protein
MISDADHSFVDEKHVKPIRKGAFEVLRNASSQQLVCGWAIQEVKSVQTL